MWCDTHVGLGHQQLETTPESKFDDQPVRDEDLVITADARIDNREELFRTLPISTSPTETPDSQLLLAAYRRWGNHCVEHLAGSFAFVIWDGSSETLFCARDQFGVKPLYYHLDENMFAAASEIKALLTIPDVPGNLNETKIGDFLAGMFDDLENTYYKTIQRVPPAHAMHIGAEGHEIWQYWDLNPTRTITLESDAAYERRFRELLEQAVQCRLRNDGQIGAALSGGIDSSSITVVARDLLPTDKPLHTFSNVFDDAPRSDEREYIETVIDRDGIEPHFISKKVGSLVDLDDLQDYFCIPPHNTMHFTRWERAKRADDVGVDVLLGGARGDNTIGYGLGLLPQLFLTGRWLHLRRELRSMCNILDASMREMFVRHILTEVTPDSVNRFRRRLKRQPVLLEKANPTLDSDFVDRFGLADRYKEFKSKPLRLTNRARKDQRRSLLTGAGVATFETTDLIHAAFGVEPRYPFTDTRLVEFSLAIPPTQQFLDGWTRSIARRSLDNLLPDKVQWRPWKTVMNAAFHNALAREDERLQQLFSNPGPLEKYLDMDELRERYDQFYEHGAPQDANILWRALSLWVWLTHRRAEDDPYCVSSPES
ncbi:asparagine synthase (glutamine-hydrolysing) [Halorientalis persicus]|uniref:Putative asparagine synthetase [glutamine-hydrolyzing] n=2 Tax=Halorientalis persicus TaxID=1367881 RepID=A0A1H8W0A6_9EURY|nr:asparagine synthase (glutamine-hydrolysing) [Halorientalis persicus]